VPSPNSVALGVATDDTVGTAVLTAEAVEAAVWDAMRIDHTTAGTYGNTDEWAGAIDSQQIRDAMKLAPSAGAPEAESIDAKIDARAAPGDKMDFVDAPNAVAVTAIQSSLAVPGDAMTLTGGERASIAGAVWDRLTTALTTVGSVGAYLLAKIGLITSGAPITVQSPVATGGAVSTIKGDDYKAADGRAIEWTSTTWPDLTGAAISVQIEGVPPFTGEVVTPSGAAVIRLELTATQSAMIPEGSREFMVFATRSSEESFTLVHDLWKSQRRVSA